MTEEERVTSFVSVRLPRKQAGRHRYDEGMRPLTSVIGRVTLRRPMRIEDERDQAQTSD